MNTPAGQTGEKIKCGYRAKNKPEKNFSQAYFHCAHTAVAAKEPCGI
jgi:hypothetical protein